MLYMVPPDQLIIKDNKVQEQKQERPKEQDNVTSTPEGARKPPPRKATQADARKVDNAMAATQSAVPKQAVGQSSNDDNTRTYEYSGYESAFVTLGSEQEARKDTGPSWFSKVTSKIKLGGTGLSNYKPRGE